MDAKKMTAGETAMQRFTYEGNPITFATCGNVMMNATQMCKPFGKTPKDWLRTNQAQDFINTLSVVRQKCLTDLVVVYQGGTTQGTWMHEDVAVEFARWLSPKFAIWCNDRIKDMLRGMSSPTSQPLPAGRLMPRNRSEKMSAFYRELQRWTTSADVDEVAAMTGCKRKTVLEARRGARMHIASVELLVSYAMDNRRENRQTDIISSRPQYIQQRLEQLCFDFMKEEGGAL